MNLLAWLPRLTQDDLEVIAVALRTGPSKRLTHYGYYRDAAQDRQIPLFEYDSVTSQVKHLAQRMPFWPQVRETLRKLKTKPDQFATELEQGHPGFQG
jgi:hypothetical protein